MAKTARKTGTTGYRLGLGSALIEAARNTDTGPIASAVRRFSAAHRVHARAQKVVDRAEIALGKQQRKLGAADIAQDRCVDELAQACVGAGAKLTRPFGDLTKQSPSEIKRLGYVTEAEVCQKLVTAIARNSARPAVLAASRRLARAAQAVIDANEPITLLKRAVTDAAGSREAVAQEWETSYEGVRQGAQAADTQKGTRLVDALLVRTADAKPVKREVRQAAAAAKKPAPQKRAKPATPPAPVPATPSPT
jgi:hypothetical protein